MPVHVSGPSHRTRRRRPQARIAHPRSSQAIPVGARWHGSAPILAAALHARGNALISHTYRSLPVSDSARAAALDIHPVSSPKEGTKAEKNFVDTGGPLKLYQQVGEGRVGKGRGKEKDRIKRRKGGRSEQAQRCSAASERENDE
ncbi:hypothetical protein C8R47DRAFT_1083756 [Mycena vitilis]|nr:hypothetical protein C8R47DRAFT_1083756 [Mycena vitilis]